MPELIQPSAWMILPFIGLLGMIALGPPLFPEWWSKHFLKGSFVLGGIVIAYYLFDLHAELRIAGAAKDYFSFITLIAALFVVSGGIHITVQGESTPLENVRFLLVGALLANVFGTTGASMLLIRPWIRMNKYRITAYHIVFFIFIVSNVGGSLTPIADPPLFLGYLAGVPFWAVAKACWPIWATGVALLATMFYFVDQNNYRRAPKPVREKLALPSDHFHFQGLLNLFFLAAILGAVFIKRPIFLREMIMIAAAIASYFLTSKHIHLANHFNLHPIKEVAILFAGIFATMIPALDWLAAHAGKFAKSESATFYFASGLLSSVLDNAPTYLCFLNALSGPAGSSDASTLLRENPQILWAISIGSVFFGANTYIANGPNLMVKAIADHQNVHTPGFINYIRRFTLPFMVPTLLVIWLIFFRR